MRPLLVKRCIAAPSDPEEHAQTCIDHDSLQLLNTGRSSERTVFCNPDTLNATRQSSETVIMCFSMQLEVMAMHGNGPARRNLFGPVDHEQLQLEYRDALRKDLEDASRRWGFDFATETPLEGGDFQWEGVSEVKVPILYRAGHRSRSGSGKDNVPRTPERFGTVPQDVEKTPEKRTELKRKQTSITGEVGRAKQRCIISQMTWAEPNRHIISQVMWAESN